MGKTGFQVSELVENRYRVLSILGTGGMGTVYRVADEARDGEVVALKTLTLDTSVSKFVEGFKREFRILAQLRHPNLVSVYDYGITVAGDLYFTMEYVEGQNLESYVQQLGTVVTIPLMVQICRALAYIHARGVIHGDLKPANVLVVGVRVKIMDFGVAREARSAEASRSWLGTLGYVAPEVQLQHPVDRRADLYSLGAVWYRLLVGEPPMFMPGHERLAHLALAGVLETQEEVPETIGAVVTRLMATSPDDRYVSANAVITAINEATGSSYALETRETAASYALQGRFVGREEEMEALQAAWQRARDAGGQVALVGGEEGVGKSRLLQEFEVQAELAGAWVARGQCVESGSSAYHPWREVLRVLVRYVESAETVSMQRLGGVLAALLPELWQRPYLEGVAPPLALEPQAEQLRLNSAIAQVLRGAAVVRPTVVVIEDGHWADEATLELLSFLARIPAHSGLLVCVTYRDDEIGPEHVLARLDGGRVERIPVRSLSPEVTSELVCSMLGLEQLPALLIERVQRTTEGNAYFVQELMRSLAEEGVVLQRTVTGWQVDSQSLLEAALPDSIHHVVLRRLERLSALEQAVLQWAAVVGPVFWDGVIVQMGEVAREEVQAVLGALRDKGLIIEREEPAFVGMREYAFEHATLHEVTYESVLQGERPTYHGRVAEWLIAHSGERESEYTGLIADHFAKAGELERSLEYSLPAARQAQAAYANEEALLWHERTLEMLDQLGPEKASPFQSLRLLVRQSLGEVLTLMARYDEALEHYASARALFEVERLGADQARQLADLCRQTAEVYEGLSEYDRALGWLDRGLNYLDENEPTVEMMRIYNLYGEVCIHQGEYEAAQTWLERALNMARAARMRLVEADSLRTLGVVCWCQGDYARARAYYEQALCIHREIGDRRGEGSTLNNLGIVSACLGDHAGASAYFEQALLIKREIGDQQGEGIALNNLGITYESQGDYAGARTYHEQSLLILREIGDRQGEGIVLGNLGLLSHHLGNDEAARQYSQQALFIAQDIGDCDLQSDALSYLGHALVGMGLMVEATDAYQRALALRHELGQPHLAIEPLAGLSRVSMSQGDMSQAQAQVEEILSYLETGTLDGTDEPFRIYLTCYRVLYTNQDPRAQDILNTAHNLLQEKAAKISDEEMRRSFLENVTAHREIVSEFANLQIHE